MDKFQHLSSHMPAHTASSRVLDDILTRIDFVDNAYIGQFSEFSLYSVYQPIFSFAHLLPVGHEALIRGYNNKQEQISPFAIFSRDWSNEQQLILDRLCRTLHMANYVAQGGVNMWLFLNVSPYIVVNFDSKHNFITQLLQHYDVQAHQIVIEIIESVIDDERLLADAVKFYKELGCLIAIDDFGAGHSNFNRIWSLEPDIVKLDRSLIKAAPSNKLIHRSLPSLVKLIHEAGSLVLMEGIETEEEAQIAIESEVDLAQGFLFARPHHNMKEITNTMRPPLKLSLNSGTRYITERYRHLKKIIKPYEKLLVDAGFALSRNIDDDVACEHLFKYDGVASIYILNKNGKQIGMSLISSDYTKKFDIRFSPLLNTFGTSWQQRHYFKRAIQYIGEVQVSRPYLSLIGANMCITLSYAYEYDNTQRVICCDLDWEYFSNIIMV